MIDKDAIRVLFILILAYLIGAISVLNHYIILNNRYKEQKKINEALYEAHEELRTNYDILEIQYKRDLEDCYTQFGDYQDKVEAGCYVNGGWNCE